MTAVSEPSFTAPSSTRSTLRAWVPIAVLGVVLAVTLVLGRAREDNSIGARAERIASSIKCAVCQGLSVAQSKEGSARAIYDEITRQVEAGRSDADIRGFVAGRYGAELLLRPASTGVSSLVWALPVALGVGALGALAVAFHKWAPPSAASLSPVDAALFARARRQQLDMDDPDPDGDLEQASDVSS